MKVTVINQKVANLLSQPFNPTVNHHILKVEKQSQGNHKRIVNVIVKY
jgi:hypothetical protein